MLLVRVQNTREYVISTMRSGGSTDRNEVDSHADTTVGGPNCVLLETNGETATVHSFSDERKPFADVPIGTIATAWVNRKTGETFVLIYNEALYFGNRLDHTLLCPNQMRAHGIVVDDTPRQFNKQSTHSIYMPEVELSIPLEMRGVISYFESHKPSEDELENCRRIVMTSDVSWNPYDESFETQERAANQHAAIADEAGVETARVSEVDRNGDIKCGTRTKFAVIPDPPELLSDEAFVERLVASVNIASDDLYGDGMDGYRDQELFQVSSATREVFEMSRSEKKSVVTKEVLARRWGIGLDTAHRTLKQTTLRGVRSVILPTDRRVSTWKPHLVFPTMRRKKLYTDTMFSKVKSVRQNTCAQVWTDGYGYDLVYPMNSKKYASSTVKNMVHDMQGIPEVIFSDGAGEETGASWKKEIGLIRARHHVTEPHLPWQNRAEGDIREIRRGIKRQTQRAGSPKRVWDFCAKLVAAIRRKTAHNFPCLDGLTPEESVHARVADISAYAQFGWYDHVWYIDQGERKLGRWLGVAEGHGAPMTYWILPKSCRPIPRSSVFEMTDDEKLSPEIKASLEALDEAIQRKIGDNRTDAEVEDDLPGMATVPDGLFEDDADDYVVEPAEGEEQVPDADEFYSPEVFDQYLMAQVLLDRGGESQLGTVKQRKRDYDGNPVGRSNTNPLLDSREYEVEFPDGSIDVLMANAIAEALYSQVDDEGWSYAVLSGIVDHKKDGTALLADDAFIQGTGQR